MTRSLNFLSLSRPLFYLLLLSFYIIETDSTPLLAFYVVSTALFVTTSAVIVRWIPAPPAWPAYCLYAEIGWATVLTMVANLDAPPGPAPALFTAIFASLFIDLDRRQVRPVLAAVTSLWILSFWPALKQDGLLVALFQVGIYGSFNLFAAGMGSLMRGLTEEKERSEELLAQVKESQAALERAHRQLQESAGRQQEMAVLEERQRLAREIHDSVAHNLTALVVQIQAARRLLELAPQQTAEGLARCEEMARQALLETRQAVRALHPSGLNQQSEVEALRRLGRDFGAATGILVTVEADEPSRQLPPDPLRLEQLYRIFQEAMTNAHRHGQARRIEGRLALQDGMLELTITNDGAPPTSLEPGVGLRAMAERARALGGTIAFEPGGPGLTIRVTAPVKQEAAVRHGLG